MEYRIQKDGIVRSDAILIKPRNLFIAKIDHIRQHIVHEQRYINNEC